MTDRRFLFAGLALVMTSCLQEADDRTQTATAAPSPLSAATGSYLVGTGIYDITGPAAEIGMMGYADSSQKTAGIHTRLRARTFIVGDGQKRVVFVSADLGMLFESVKLKVELLIVSADASVADKAATGLWFSLFHRLLNMAQPESASKPIVARVLHLIIGSLLQCPGGCAR